MISLRRGRNGLCVFVDSRGGWSGEAELLTDRSVFVRQWGRVMDAITAMCSVVDSLVVHVSLPSESYADDVRNGSDSAVEAVSHGEDGDMDISNSKSRRRVLLRMGFPRNRACSIALSLPKPALFDQTGNNIERVATVQSVHCSAKKRLKRKKDGRPQVRRSETFIIADRHRAALPTSPIAIAILSCHPRSEYDSRWSGYSIRKIAIWTPFAQNRVGIDTQIQHGIL
jgi:hypothetical protein